MAMTLMPRRWQSSTSPGSSHPRAAEKTDGRSSSTILIAASTRSGARAGRAVVVGIPRRWREAVEHLLGSAQRLLANRVGIDGRPEGAVQPQVHTERAARQLARAVDHLSQIVRRNVEPGQDPEASGAADLYHQLGTGDGAHAGLDDRVFDVEEIAQRCAEGHGAVSLWPSPSAVKATAVSSGFL